MNYKEIYRKLLSMGIVCTITAGMLSGCGSDNKTEEMTQMTDAAEQTENTETQTMESSENAEESDAEETEASDIETSDTESYKLDTTDMFTERDLSGEYSDNQQNIDLTNEKDTLTISEEGTYILTGSFTGQIIVDAEDAKVQIVLDNAEIENETSAAIYVKSANKVFITTTEGSSNSISVTGEFEENEEENIDAAIYSKADLTLNGNGSLTVNCTNGHGVVSKDSLIVTNGSYDITSGKSALNGKDDVRIADGTFNIIAGTDGIHGDGDDDVTEDPLNGFVYIEGGTFNICAEDDGIHAEGTLQISNGSISIDQSYEGLEGGKIVIEDGIINVASSDDGLNAASGSSSTSENTQFDREPGTKPDGQMPGGQAPGKMGGFDSNEYNEIHIEGGSLTVVADGDGIDSNGSIEITGGTVLVSGPSNDGNAALDSGGEIIVNGGLLLAAGSSGMAERLSDQSTQNHIEFQFDSYLEGEISISDDQGNVLISFDAENQFNYVEVSSPELIKGNTYQLICGDTNVEKVCE